MSPSPPPSENICIQCNVVLMRVVYFSSRWKMILEGRLLRQILRSFNHKKRSALSDFRFDSLLCNCCSEIYFFAFPLNKRRSFFAKSLTLVLSGKIAFNFFCKFVLNRRQRLVGFHASDN